MYKVRKITDAELEVLKVLWEKNTAITSNDIFEELKDKKGWEKTTVRTLIMRLTKKGALRKEKRNIYYYSPAISEKTYLADQTKLFLHKNFSGSAKSFIASLFEQDYVDSNEIDELKQFWSKASSQDYDK